LTALFIGFANESGWTQSIALVVIEALLFLVICFEVVRRLRILYPFQNGL
jgi:hypothetical protein